MIKNILSNKLVRYGMSAGVATSVDVLVYFITFNYILRKQDIGITEELVISSPIATLVVSYTCGLITNFTITKYFVFTESDLRGHHQFLRYVLVAILILLLNYLLMSIMVKLLYWYPTISRAVSAVAAGFASFAFHRVFSFRVNSSEKK